MPGPFEVGLVMYQGVGLTAIIAALLYFPYTKLVKPRLRPGRGIQLQLSPLLEERLETALKQDTDWDRRHLRSQDLAKALQLYLEKREETEELRDDVDQLQSRIQDMVDKRLQADEVRDEQLGQNGEEVDSEEHLLSLLGVEDREELDEVIRLAALDAVEETTDD